MEKEWRKIAGYDNYEISNYGEIRNTKTNRILKLGISNCGYNIAVLSKNGCTKTFSVHRLVLETFNPIDNMERLEVNHKDWDKQNNRLDNLEWNTRRENLLYGSGPTELRVLENMLTKAIKQTLREYYEKLLTVKCTKEKFTERVIEDAIKGSIDFYNETH